MTNTYAVANVRNGSTETFSLPIAGVAKGLGCDLVLDVAGHHLMFDQTTGRLEYVAEA